MKKSLLSVFIIAAINHSIAQEIAANWAFTNLNNFTFNTSTSIATDSDNNVYVAGNFRGLMDFDPSAAVNSLSTTAITTGFIAKYDANGNYIWSKKLGSTNDLSVKGIAIDANNNVCITGYFYGDADFDPDDVDEFVMTSAGTFAGQWDSFVCKLDEDGDFIWAKQLGGTGHDQASCIAVDANGNIYSAGVFGGISDYNPGVGTFDLTAAGAYDGYISKLDANGNFVWAKRLGGSVSDHINSICIDAANNVLTTGYFGGTADFNPDVAATENLTAVGDDVFISKLDLNGDFVWVKQVGGVGSQYANCISTDNAGNIFTAGIFNSMTDFDPDIVAAHSLTSTGSSDSYVLKLSSSGNFADVFVTGGSGFGNFIGVNSLAVDANNNIYTQGIFGGTIDFNHSVTQSNESTAATQDIYMTKINADGTYDWHAQLTATTNSTAKGITVDNQFNVISTGVFTGTMDFDPGLGNIDSTCYTGGKAIFIHSLVQCNLDASVTLTGATLTSNQSGATYQWMDCSTFSNVGGATNQNFSPSADGDYAVIVTQGGCKDTSTCYTVSGVGLNELNQNIISVFPNPTNANLTIQSAGKINTIAIYNAAGLLIQTETKNTFSVENLPAGIYFLQIQTDNGNSTARFVKE